MKCPNPEDYCGIFSISFGGVSIYCAVIAVNLHESACYAVGALMLSLLGNMHSSLHVVQGTPWDQASA